MIRRLTFILLAAIAAFFLLLSPAFATNAQVFKISGGTSAQQALVGETLEASTWDWSWGADKYPHTDLTLTPSFPPYWGETMAAASYRPGIPFIYTDDFGAAVGVALWPWGDIYIDSRIDSDSFLREVTMHEAAHARIMFRWFIDAPSAWTGAPALLAWQELICPEFTPDDWDDFGADWYSNPVEAHAEWFRVTYFDPALQLNPTARTLLPDPPNGIADVRAFHDKWAPREQAPPPEEPPVPPFKDIPADDRELVEAVTWGVSKGIIQGYLDDTFRPWDPLLKRHVALITQRSGLVYPPWANDYGPATRAQVRDALPGLPWDSDRWDESITRSQLLRLMWRMAEIQNPDEAMAAKLDAWFAEKVVTWQGITRSPRLEGYGGLIVAEAREHNVPIWLAVAQSWRESQWGTTGLSVKYNMLWGVKDIKGKWGELRSVVSSFADYVTVEENIRAYFRLMDGAYRAYIDTEDWRGLLNRYDPIVSDEGAEHYQIVMAIRGACERRSIW